MKRHWLWGLVGLAAVLLAVGFALYSYQHSDAARRAQAVAQMAENWNGEMRFEAAYDALDPSASTTAAEGGDATARGGFDPNDQYWGLPRNPGYEEVAAYCAACHSVQLVMQQNRNERRWNELIDWMIAQQGMPSPPPEDRQRIVDYLVRNYGE